MPRAFADALPRRRQSLLALLVLLCLFSPGCVRRRMTIRSNPPGALVTVDNREVGVTPVSVPYTYYGTREIRLELDGHQTVVEKHTFYPPWYEYPGLDFISENIVPWELRDERILNFDLAPQAIVPVEEIVARAENLRSNTRSGLATPTYVPTGPSATGLGAGTPFSTVPYEPPPSTIGVNRPETLPPGGAVLPSPGQLPPSGAPAQLQPANPQGNFPPNSPPPGATNTPQRLPRGGYVIPGQ
ncbi:MAG: PEGA domain-containing protein [Planctomycetales bacterium]|nr:PEGA domain-containing protein [Planctomycetales bacterium]